MVADGADRILAAGAGSNGGIFKAVQDASGVNAFGVDVESVFAGAGSRHGQRREEDRRRDRTRG